MSASAVNSCVMRGALGGLQNRNRPSVCSCVTNHDSVGFSNHARLLTVLTPGISTFQAHPHSFVLLDARKGRLAHLGSGNADPTR